MSARTEFFWLGDWARKTWHPPLVWDQWTELARDEAVQILDTLDHERNVGMDEHHRRELTVLRHNLHYANERNAERNKQLDAFHMVWCDGGCSGGMHRYTDKLTADEVLELVALAEANIARMKRWAASAAHRAARGTSI